MFLCACEKKTRPALVRRFDIPLIEMRWSYRYDFINKSKSVVELSRTYLVFSCMNGALVEFGTASGAFDDKKFNISELFGSSVGVLWFLPLFY